jgi:hypothetical protein
MNKVTKLNWSHDKDTDVHRACDDLARSVISVDQGGKYKIGSFPTPGLETIWHDGLESLEDAKFEAINCAKHVHDVRRKIDQ